MKWLLRNLTFDGRITRLTFWLSVAISWLLLFLTVAVVSHLFGSKMNEDGFARIEDVSTIGQVFSGILVLLVSWFSVCLEVRRWHDRGKSGWWFWIGFIPVIGGIWTLIECGFRRGTEGPNRYGEDPNSVR
jgi:uncharacterized membrane protein YhaH (DUF805 family)